MRRQAAWRMLLTAAFLALMPCVAQAEIDPATAQKLLADDSTDSDSFGLSVSVSGGTAVIGADGDDDKGSNSGSAYVFVRADDGTWSQQAKLTAEDGTAGDYFGYSVSINGDTIVVGSVLGDKARSRCGAAYVFVRSGTNWTQQAKLTAGDPSANDHFGGYVSLDVDTVVIGSYADDDKDKGIDSGSAYVFVRSGTNWTQQAKLTADDGADGDIFGMSVSVSGDTAVIGASLNDAKGTDDAGAAYVFTRSGTNWSKGVKLTAPDPVDIDDMFGRSVSVSGDTIVIGSVWDDDKGMNSGSAYVFTRSGSDSDWELQKKLTASDGAADHRFGRPVSVSGNTVVIGSYGENENGWRSGSAYVFSRSGTVWTEQAKLTDENGAAEDMFGYSVSVDGNAVIVGAYGNDSKADNAGAAYVFGSGNTAPVAATGPNQSVIQGEKVCFDGSGSTDADGDLLSYLWTLMAWPAGSGAVLDNPTVDKPCITADLPGTYQVSLIVNDGTVDSKPSTAEAVAISCQDVAREAVKAVNALDPSVFKHENNQENLTKGILEVIALVDQQLYAEALLKLEGGSVLGKTDGCAASGAPDNNDWILDCTSQATVYPLLQQAIVCVQRL